MLTEEQIPDPTWLDEEAAHIAVCDSEFGHADPADPKLRETKLNLWVHPGVKLPEINKQAADFSDESSEEGNENHSDRLSQKWVYWCGTTPVRGRERRGTAEEETRETLLQRLRLWKYFTGGRGRLPRIHCCVSTLKAGGCNK